MGLMNRPGPGPVVMLGIDVPRCRRAVAIALLCLALPAHGEDEARPRLLLRDFDPQSMLHARVTTVEHARFPVIDVHNHVNDARSADEHIPPAKVIEIMDATNVRTAVILTGAWGDKLQRVVD